MSSRSVTTVVTADTMALNAAVFGFAGHSLVTPHQAIQNIWWTDERIEAKVTREFIVSKLRPNEREQLYRPLFGGSELTEDTYLDWILQKAKRIYLILVECGVSDQIFGIMEDSWDDGDLPIPKEEVPRLALSYKDDEGLNKKFYSNQFRFLLRPLDFHKHIYYAPNEVIPVEFVHRLAPAAALQKWSRMHLPKLPSLVYVRRKVSLGEKEEVDPVLEAQFLQDVETARSIEHEHIAPVCATWSQKGTGYFMTSFVAEHTLKSFIDFRTPASMQKTKKQERSILLLEWMHCLSTGVAYLHRRNFHHGKISPSNILVDENNKVAFADLGCLESFQRDKRLDADELFNYGSPEFYIGDQKLSPSVLRPPTPTRKFFGHRRGKSSISNMSDGKSETGSTFSADTMGSFFFKGRSNSKEAISPQFSRTSDDLARPNWSPNGLILSPNSNMEVGKISNSPSREAPPPPLVPLQHPEANTPDPKAGDIYSLGCIFLDIITFILKRKPTEFTKHRSTKHRNASGKNSYIDSSFRNNAQKVKSWMEILDDEVSAMQEPSLLALTPIFSLITEMLNPEAHRRPSAAEVQDRVYDALVNFGGLDMTHCTNNVRSPSIASIPTSYAGTTLSGGSSSRPSRFSGQPRIAAFPPAIFSPPPVGPKSPVRPFTPASSSIRSVTPGRLDASLPPPPPPAPLLQSRYSKLPQERIFAEGMSNKFKTLLGVSVQ